MRSVRILGLVGVCATAMACGATVGADYVPGSDGAILTDAGRTPDADVVSPPRDGGGSDALDASRDVAMDTRVGSDGSDVPHDAGNTPDVIVVAPDTVVVTPDVVVVTPDVVVVTPDVVTPPGPDAASDAATACTLSADTCALAGACPSLLTGRNVTLLFDTANADHAISCGTSTAHDVVLPLVVGGTSDVTVTAAPFSGNTAQVAIYRSSDCNAVSNEIVCATGSSDTPATARGFSLPAGTYYVVVKSVNAQPVTVGATVTPAVNRPAGDLCPGIVLTTGTTTTPHDNIVPVNVGTFANTADYGTTCGSSGNGTGFVDVVMQYTLAQAQDVTISVTSDSVGGAPALSVQVESACGSSAALSGACGTGTTGYTKVIRNQPAGTYFVVAEYPVARGNHTLDARVSLAAPTAADSCPGLPLTEGTVSSVAVSSLTANYTLACLPMEGVDGVFSFVAPAAGNDVIVVVNNTDPAGRSSGFQLESICNGALVGACEGPGMASGPSSVSERYQGLTAGATYYVVAGARATAGNLTAGYYVQATATPVTNADNATCATAQTVPATGGVFNGDTTGHQSASNDSNADYGGGSCRGCVAVRGRDSLYRMVLTTRSRVIATVTSVTGFDPMLYVRRTTECPNAMLGQGPTTLACNDDTFGTRPQLDLTLDAGTYLWAVDTCSGVSFTQPLDNAVGPFTIDFTVLPAM